MRLALRPLRRDDRAALVCVLGQLSFESRLNRFFAPLLSHTESMLARLTDVDQTSQFAWLASVGEGAGAKPIAVARYVRLSADSPRAEIGIAVADAFQHRGVGTALLRALAVVARRNGIKRFVGRVRTENHAARELLSAAGAKLGYAGPDALRFELRLDSFIRRPPQLIGK